jgi:hypothetical protein
MLQLWFVANTVLWPFLLSLGGLQLTLNVAVLTLSGGVWLAMRRRVAKGSALAAAILIAYMVFSTLTAVAGPCNDTFSKLVITAPILVFLALIGLEVGRRSSDEDWIKLQKTAMWCLLAAFLSFLIERAWPSQFPNQVVYRIEGKYSGLFKEPSHVAFALFPCVALLLVAESRKVRRVGLAALLGLLLVSRSSTLIAMIAAWVLYRLVVQRRLRQAALPALGLALLVALASAINYNALLGPTVNRIEGVALSSETENISSLVYVQGWQDAIANLKRTHGLGLGFDMMGCQPLPDVPARQALTLTGLETINAQDGSFLFGKVVSEAGVGGIAFYIAIVWWWIRIEKAIRAAHGQPGQAVAVAQAALIFCFLASSFIRGLGYFSGGLLLWISAMGGASQWRKNLAIRVSWASRSHIAPMEQKA